MRVPGLSSSNQNTYLGDRAPDAILYGSLIEAVAFMKEIPQQIEMWNGYYSRALQTLANEEQIRMRNDEFRNGELKTMTKRTISMAITSAIANSFKQEILVGTHNFTASSGHTFKLALIKANASQSGTYNASTTNYSDVTGNSDELPNGSGYTTGGNTLTSSTPVLDSYSCL